MGPFGIAAVGLLANKGSGSRQKRDKATDAKASSGSSNETSHAVDHSVAACVADGASPGSSDRTTSFSVAKRRIRALGGSGNKIIQCEVSDGFRMKSVLSPRAQQSEIFNASLAREAKPSTFEPKEKGPKAPAKPLVSGLSHIKTRLPPDSVRTVESALDTSEPGLAASVGLIEEGRPVNSWKHSKRAPGRNEQIPIRLRRSGRISPDSADTLLLNMQRLTINGTVLRSESSHCKDATYSYASSAEDRGWSSTNTSSENDPWTIPEQLPRDTLVNCSVHSELVHGSVPSNLELELTMSKGLAVGNISFEKDLSQRTLQHTEMDENKETDSPRFSALLRLTGGLSTKKTSAEIISFSHELSSTVSTSHLFWRFPNPKNTEDLDDTLQARFCSAKELVNSELALFGADLVDIMEAKEGKRDKDIQVKQEDLLVLARDCSVMSVSEFREQCEGIVQRLEEERQLLPLGRLKQLHIRLLIILTRCTRLLQYQKENAAPKDVLTPYKSGFLGNGTGLAVAKVGIGKKFYSQEQRVLDWTTKNLATLESEVTEMPHVMTEQKPGPKLSNLSKPPLAEKANPRTSTYSDQSPCGALLLSSKLKENISGQKLENKELLLEIERLKGEGLIKRNDSITSKRRKKLLEDVQHVICRICEDKVPTFCLEEHSHVCALAVQCDVKGVSVDDRLCKLALILDKLIESCAPNTTLLLQGDSPDKFKTCAFNQAVFSNDSKRLDATGQRDDELQDDPETGTEVVSFKSMFGSKSELSQASSSVGSITPKTPLINGSYFDVNLDDRVSLGESEDPLQIGDLADIARCVASTNTSESGALDYMASCFQDLQNLLQQTKDEALTIHTFGKRIEKLLRAKYLELYEVLNATTTPNSAAAESLFIEESPSQILRPAPAIVPYKDRTSIDDFEIIKPVSRGAFGRVFLARKRTTGDLFAIKVLRKADMIRKNAVDSILAERNILISICNPFVVRFFYSFTCSENLYLVMEYLIGGDLYSLLRNVGCLDEKVSQIYVAELVLALEYLHSLGVVHRDLKPDNLLIAHDGHLKLTDFGLSKVGLINSTDDLSGPCSSRSLLQNTDAGIPQTGFKESRLRKKRQKQSAVGTPDYLAPEILLGFGHGNSADWWSAGIILFECLTGVPPFNAEHPQRIFENILNRKIPWPRIPEDMSADAKDLIDKLLAEDPSSRLGANGAAEVKHHPFFKNINWDTLARQKAAFVPAPESPQDTSYFTSRHCWSGSDGLASLSIGSGQPQYLSDEEERREKVDEQFDQPGDLVGFSSSPSSRFSFSNFSFKNLSQLASINYDLLLQNSKSEPKASIQ